MKCLLVKFNRQCSEFLSRPGHIGTLSLAHKIPDSGRSAQHNPYCLYKQLRFNEPFLSENDPEIQISKYQLKGPLVTDLPRADSLRPALLILFCTTHIPSICWTPTFSFILLIFSSVLLNIFIIYFEIFAYQCKYPGPLWVFYFFLVLVSSRNMKYFIGCQTYLTIKNSRGSRKIISFSRENSSFSQVGRYKAGRSI